MRSLDLSCWEKRLFFCLLLHYIPHLIVLSINICGLRERNNCFVNLCRIIVMLCSAENSLGTWLYNVSYSVNTQLYISTVILHIHSGHIMETCFDLKRPSSGQWGTFLRYNKVRTQWDPCTLKMFPVGLKMTV